MEKPQADRAAAFGRFAAYLPILRWGPRYNRAALADDALAAVVVALMLIPQSLAYALIAGLPPEAGLYASIAPLVAYAFFGTSTALSIGPVAVISLMTAASVGDFAARGTASYGEIAMTLAVLSGLILLALGFLRLGFLANFLSHPIIVGFITASCVLIAIGQLKHVIGVEADGDTIVEIAVALARHASEAHLPTLAIGLGVILFLVWARGALKPLLIAAGAQDRVASLIARGAPLGALIGTTFAAALLDLEGKGVAVVGDTPAGLPHLFWPAFDGELWRALFVPALLIGVIAYVESVSMAQTFAAKRRERINLDQELIALGACNVAAGATGGFPVAGGLSRTVVNFDAGARTPLAGAFAAIGIALAALFLAPYIHHLPKATLAATIIIAVLALIDVKEMTRTLRYSKADFAAMIATIAGVFAFGVEAGLVAGLILSIALLLHRASRPHSAIVGQMPGTEHFRNVRRHDVITSLVVVAVRIDGDLFFANAQFLEDRVLAAAASKPTIRHVVLVCSAINSIDATALHALESVNHRLKEQGVSLHFSEVKGPVMDMLKRSNFLDHMTGRIFLSTFEAVRALDPDTFVGPAAALHPKDAVAK
jgi:SulP family sulfate permease